MKTKFTLFLFVLLFAFTISSFSQALLPFKASEGLSFANGEAKKSSSDPKLRSIASLSGNFGGQNLTFDLTNGTSTMWVYVYQDGTNKDSLVVVPVLSIKILAVTYINAKTIIGNLPIGDFLKYLPSSILTTTNWINSNEMCLDIVANSDYKSFIAANPNEKPSLIGLGNNELNPLLKKNEPYWTVTIGNTASTVYINCSVHALTRETSCVAFKSSVEDEFALNNPAYPNPSKNIVYFSVPENFIKDDSMLELFNNEGQKILENKIYKVDGNNYNLPIDFLTNGTYFIKVGNANFNFIHKFVVSK